MFPIHTTVVSRNVPVVTWTIIGLNVLVFFVELHLPPDVLEDFFYLFGVVPARYTHPAWATYVGFPVDDYWPFLTSMFLHGGWLHIIGNMWTLWLFGMHVEDRVGPLRYALFYLACGVASGVIHTYLQSTSTVPAIGASGAISGVMAAYLVMFPLSRVVVMIPVLFFPFFFDFPAFLYLGFWFLLQLLSGVWALRASPLAGGIAFWAHVGGFTAGIVLFELFLRRRARARDRTLHDDEGSFHHAWAA